MTRYTLPDLRYDPGALEPHLAAKVVELHHGKHHRAYVEAANEAEERLQEARSRADASALAGLQHALTFNVAGHVLHSLYWQNLSPEGGGAPEGELAEAIGRDLGGFETLRSQMVQLAKSTMGSGWAALAFEACARRLVTLQIHDHQSEIVPGSAPLLVVDAWEHAYYAQYGADKDAYLRAIWNVVDWDDVAARYARALQVDLRVSHAADDRLLPLQQGRGSS